MGRVGSGFAGYTAAGEWTNCMVTDRHNEGRGLWSVAAQRTLEFAAAATNYDQYRLRYPASHHTWLMNGGGLSASSHVVEIGAATGIAT